jgi:hypothetical protein
MPQKKTHDGPELAEDGDFSLQIGWPAYIYEFKQGQESELSNLISFEQEHALADSGQLNWR